MRRLAYDVQRDMTFYRVAVEFRNAVERCQIREGRSLNAEHLWWGFGDSGRPFPGQGDDGGMAGARVPRRPLDDDGEELVALQEPFARDEDAIEAT